MSQNETARGVERPEISESPGAAMSKLSELAQQAYKKKDKKECLDLTRSMLLIDPHNADALWIRSSIQSDIQRDLDSAREFLRQAQPKESADKPAPAGESLTPSSEAVTLPVQSESLPASSADSESFVEARRGPLGRWLVAAVILVLGVAGIVVLLPKLKTPLTSVATSVAVPDAAASNDKVDGGETALHPDVPSPPPPVAEVANSLPARPSAVLPNVPPAVLSTTAPTHVSTPPAAVTPASAPRPEPALPDPSAAIGRGMLAISSPTTVDIYRNDVYLGSVPVSLELPAGSQTLEYRHGSLRKTVTHIINNNETTKATITFDVAVPINSKPWAKVYLDGAEKKDLGQTPLGGARISIGSVLIFENPNFPPKQYRVTGNESGIQVVFP